MIKEHDLVTVLSGEHVNKTGTVVFVYTEPMIEGGITKICEVEFVTNEGSTVVTLSSDVLQCVKGWGG